ncbi:MAG: hypothetical protein HMLKMBBP_02285 [Planctomycetes bacterium]|nr:hypothetical protein [Planctomycetota bacterium]
MSLLRTSVRAAVAGLVLVLGAAVGGAADVSGQQGLLVSDLRARVTAIGTPPTTPALAKEAKALGKAATKLEAFGGFVDSVTVAGLVPAFKQIAKSGTEDAGLRDSISDYVATVVGCLGDEGAAAALGVSQIYVIADRLKAQQRLDDALEAFNAAVALSQEDAVTSFDEIAAAAVPLAKAIRFIDKTRTRLSEQLLPRMQEPLTIQNANGKPFKVTQIIFDVFVTPSGGGDPVRVRKDWNNVVTEASGPTLPYTFTGQFSEFDLYPTFLEALATSGIPNLNGAHAVGSMRFVSVRFGTVDVPIDLVVFVD